MQKANTMKPFLLIAGLYVLFFSFITLLSGHASRFGDEGLFFYPFGDGPGYKQLADYYTSFGNAPIPDRILLDVRPFLFPLYLGLYRVIGIAGVQLLQVGLNVVSLWLLYVSIKTLSGRPTIAGFCTALLALTPSFNFLAFHALTETLSIVLICIFIALLVDHFQQQRQMSLYMATFVVSLFLCVRPIALPFWILLVGYALFRWLRDNDRRIWQPAAIMTPVVCQLIFSSMMTGSITPASAGGSVFSTWYFPVVYGQQEYGKFVGRKTPEAHEALRRHPATKDKVLYLVKHYPTAIKTYLSLLVGQSFMAGSNFVAAGIPDHTERPMVRFLQWWSAKLNRFFFCVHILMLGLMAFWIMSRRPLFSEKASLTCYAFAILLIIPAGLVYFQGDRYIVLSEPLWLLAYGTLAARLVDEWSSRFGMNRLRVSPLKN
jgi:hypothetical protein